MSHFLNKIKADMNSITQKIDVEKARKKKQNENKQKDTAVLSLITLWRDEKVDV